MQPKQSSTKRAYTGLADYAGQQGAPLEAFQRAGWQEVRYRGRPALQYPTDTGNRWRYIDGQEPRHDSPTRYKPSWYRLPEAIALAAATGQPLILVNGAAGTIVAQHHGLAAFAVSDGEMRGIEPMLDSLKAVWQGEIWIAQDCDQAGQTSAKKRARALLDAGFIATAKDLRLGKAGDIADFVKVHGDQALNRLADLPEIAPDAPKEPRHATYSTSGQGRYAEWVRDVPRAAIEKLPTHKQGRIERFTCINPNHPDTHPSARVSFDTSDDGVYICTCGAHNWETVAGWLGLPSYRGWLKDTYPNERPAHKKGAKKAQADGVNGTKTARPPLPSLPPFTADLTVSLPYVSQIDKALIADKRTLVIKSATGTDKTGFNGQIISEAPEHATVLVLTHRVALVKDISKRFDIPDYKNFSDGYERSAPRLVSTIDSAYQQAGRKFDLVVMDESTQSLVHLVNAGTLKGKAAYTLEIIEQIIRDAGRVICADANNNDSFVAWLKGIRPDAFAIENTHRPGRANTQFLTSYSGAVQMAVNQVGQGQGTVLIPCAAQSTARKIHKLLTRLYPDKRGRIISARNSQTADTQEFLAVINDELPTLDWLAYTSSMGTGVNIHCPVAAVVGIAGQPVAPADLMQMLGRARHAEKRFVYAPECSGGGETNAETLFDSRQRAARYSAAYGTSQPDSGVQKLARWEAIHTAQQNREMATYRDYLAAYLQADGSAPGEADQKPARATLDALKLITEEMAQAQKTNALTLQPISTDELDKLRDSGAELTDAILDANLRYKIERSAGLVISEDLYDRLHTKENRRRLARFASLIDDEQVLVEFDRQQANERTPLHLRHNAAAARQFFLSVVKQAFGISTFEQLKTAVIAMPKDELAQRVAFIGIEHRDQLNALYGWRADGHDASLENPVGLFRWLCARHFIKFESKRIRQGDKLTYAYSIDAVEFDALLTIARARIAARLAEKKEMFQNREIKNTASRGFGTNSEHAEKTRRKPPAPGWRPSAAPRPSAGAANIDEVLKAAKAGKQPVNPFATAGAA